jgi:hypothetical protein
VIPVPWIIPALYLVAYAFGGIAMGAVTGILFSRLFRLKIQGIFKDGVLGSFGFLLGFIGTAFVPWPENTITYYVGQTLVTETMNRYQHPGRVGIVLAILLPLMRELYRFIRSKGSSSGPQDGLAPG